MLIPAVSGGDAHALGIECRRRAGEHRNIAKAGIREVIAQRIRLRRGKPGRNEDGTRREARDAPVQRVRRDAGIDDDVVIGAR